MTASFRVSPAAKSDLDQIWDYIAADNPVAATRFVQQIVARFEMLARQPEMGERRSELAAGLRDFPVGNYIIFYQPVPAYEAAIEIVRVVHGARDVRKLF